MKLDIPYLIAGLLTSFVVVGALFLMVAAIKYGNAGPQEIINVLERIGGRS